MPRKTDDTHIVAEVLAAKLSADPHVLAQLVDLGLPREVAEGTAVLVARGMQLVQILGGGELDLTICVGCRVSWPHRACAASIW